MLRLRVDPTSVPVHSLMSHDVVTVPPSLPASEAWALLRSERVRHAIVLERSRIIGVISDRDLGGSRGAARRIGRSVAHLMTRGVRGIAPTADAREAARRMREGHLGCLPVIDGNKLVGILSRSDLLRLLEGDAAPSTIAEARPRLPSLLPLEGPTFNTDKRK